MTTTPATVANVIRIQSTQTAFAAIMTGGAVACWGLTAGGGPPGTTTKALIASGVFEVFAAQSAFAALKTDGSVVAWGSSTGGGNSSAVAANQRCLSAQQRYAHNH
jgi:hypothetical protein